MYEITFPLKLMSDHAQLLIASRVLNDGSRLVEEKRSPII